MAVAGTNNQAESSDHPSRFDPSTGTAVGPHIVRSELQLYTG